MKLNPTAKAYLRDAGIPQATWTRHHGPDATWRGDACGCPDDRCIGHHHDATDDCGCLEVLMRSYLAEVAR